MRYEYFNKKNIKLGIYIVNCGYEDCCPKFICPYHKRKYYLIHYVTKGSGYYKVNDKEYFVKAGDIFIIHPDDLVTYYSPDINDTWSFCWVGFSGEDAKDYLNMAGIDNNTYIKSLSHTNFYSIIRNCLDYIENNKNSISQLKLNSYLLNALVSLIGKKKTQKSSSAVNQVDKAIRYIEYNYMNELSVSTVCEYLSLNRTYFYKIFKKYTGLPPEQYILNYKIKKSIELLKEQKLSISEISLAVGFSNQYYFSKVFKKVTGKSPSKYNNL